MSRATDGEAPPSALVMFGAFGETQTMTAATDASTSPPRIHADPTRP